MPKSGPPSEPQTPAPISAEEAALIKVIVQRFYGASAVIRDWGANPRHLALHVESDRGRDHGADECLGYLMCDIVRDQISLHVTRRGEKIHGIAKIAYRQGDIL